MKIKILNSLLIISSLFGYLEWGGNNHQFLFQAEAGIICKFFSEPSSVLHPFVLLPLFGQILLLITLFQKTPNKLLIYMAIGCLGILLAFMFVIGIMSLNFKIILSTAPFLVLAIYTILYYKKTKTANR